MTTGGAHRFSAAILLMAALLLPGLASPALAAAAAGQCGADPNVQAPPPESPPGPPGIWHDSEAAIRARRSHWIPALEILGFDFLLNQTDRRLYNGDAYDSDFSSISDNWHSHWVTDDDPFATNQLGHPYQGSIYHELARSAGLGFWESLGYTFTGSILWELAGETTAPSRNDQVASGIGGSFLGEPLFRMASLVLENGRGRIGFWRHAAAAVIAPPVVANRWLFGDRFDAIFPSRDPVYYSRLQVGVSGTTQSQPGPSTKLKRDEALLDFSLDYGLPGKPGYLYRRPFDYFSFQATASSANGFENVMTRGLLAGAAYGIGDHQRGVWGLYGSYDYIAPQIFRVSTTALSIGTTSQWGTARPMALQATGLLGVGYAAVGTIHGTGDRDYHYGFAPQAALVLRAIFGGRASLDVTARDYFVTGVVDNRGGRDNIARADLSLTLRLHHKHAIAAKYLWSRRDASYSDLVDATQTRGTVGIFYTRLGHDRFGAVDWR